MEDKNYLKCKLCGRKIGVNEVGGYDDIDDVCCESCAYKTDMETDKQNNEN